MITFLASLLCVYIAWWMFSAQFRSFLYCEWEKKPFTTIEHLKGVVPHIFKQLSPQNVVAQGFVDSELKLLNQRRSFMLFSFQRLAVIVPGIMLLCVLELEIFIALAVVATILLAVLFKKPSRWMQIAFLAGVFFTAYQWSFYQASQWIFAADTSPIVYLLTDARTYTVLGFLGASILLTLILRIEFWSLWLASILFFAGGIAYLNFVALILGQALGWAIFWFIKSRQSSKKNKTVMSEMLLVTFLTAVGFLVIITWFKSMGLLDVRIMSPIASKKISFVFAWAAWEILLTVTLSLWGHFRSQSQIAETTDIESIKIPLSVFGRGLLKYRGWLADQLQFRRNEIERRLKSIQSVDTQAVPEALLKKSKIEVESLKGLLGALD